MRFSVEGISTAVLESAAKSRVVPLERKEVMALNNLKRLVQQDRSAGIPFLAPTENVDSEERLNKTHEEVTLGAGEQMYQPGSFSIEMPGDENPSGTEAEEVGTDSTAGISDFQSALERLQEVPSTEECTDEEKEEEPEGTDPLSGISDFQSVLSQLQEVPPTEEGAGDPDWGSFAVPEEEEDFEEVGRTDDIPEVNWGSIPVEGPEEEPESKELSFDTIINKAKRKLTVRKVVASSLEGFLRENGSCTVKEAMKYFSAKEIQMKVNTGKVFSRNGVLSI